MNLIFEPEHQLRERIEQRPRRWVASCLMGLALTVSQLALPVAVAREGVDVGKNSAFSKLVPAEDVER